MSKFQVHTIYEPDEVPVADIIFMHGLGGDALETWKHANGSFWPDWLSNEAPRLRILSVNHPSDKLKSIFGGGGMTLIDRSYATLELLKTKDVGIRPVIFVCHSLGGLITKGALRKAYDKSDKDDNAILDNIAGVIFLATPHKGSALANALTQLGVASSVTKSLKSGTEPLKDLNEWYVQRAKDKSIHTKAFCEALKTNSLMVVPSTSAHPGTFDGDPIPVDKNHTDICKFEDREDATFLMIKKFILKRFNDLSIDLSGIDKSADFDFFTNVVDGDRKTLTEKLTDSGRKDELKRALRDKERVSQVLHKFAISPTERSKYKEFFGDIISRFHLAVWPEICDNKSRSAVNAKLQESVINPVKSLPGHLSTQDYIHASIYYLTGNCHISWVSEPDD